MSKTRLIKSVVLTCAAFAVALPGCTSEGSESVGGLEVDLTLTFPPGERTEILGEVRIVLMCDGVDQNLGVERSAETHMVNIRTTEGDNPDDPKSMSGLFEKAGIPAPALCDVAGTAESDSGDTTCEGFLEDVPIDPPVAGVPRTTERTMIMNCRTESDSGNLRVDAEYNQCATYREIFTGPTTQSVGNDVRVETWGYDADDDAIKVFVNSDCGSVDMGGVTIASCEEADETNCQSAVHMVTCETTGPCEIKVLTSDDNFDECNGFFDNGDVDYAARAVFDINCIAAAACGNGILETALGEECDPCNDAVVDPTACDDPTGLPTAFCDANCQEIFVCPPDADDPCDQSNECTPQSCAPSDTNTPICTDEPRDSGTCDLVANSGAQDGFCSAGECVTCTLSSQCSDGDVCTDDVCTDGVCSNPAVDNTPPTECTIDSDPGTCVDGVCEGLCADVTCTPNTTECVSNVCNPANGNCEARDDDINNTTTSDCTQTDTNPGFCDGAATCQECNVTTQCGVLEACNNNVCESTVVPLTFTVAPNVRDPLAWYLANPATIAGGGTQWAALSGSQTAPGVFDFSESIFKAYNGLLQPNPLPPGVLIPNSDQCSSQAPIDSDCTLDAECQALDPPNSDPWFCGTIGQFAGKCVEAEPAACPCQITGAGIPTCEDLAAGSVCYFDGFCVDLPAPPGSQATACDFPNLSGNLGNTLTGVHSQCVIVDGFTNTPADITGNMTFTNTGGNNYDVTGTQDLSFVIQTSVDLGPLGIVDVTITSNTSTAFSGTGTGTLADGGTITLNDNPVGTGACAAAPCNMNAAATGTVICAASGGLSGVVCPLANLLPGTNTLPFAGDPGERTFLAPFNFASP